MLEGRPPKNKKFNQFKHCMILHYDELELLKMNNK